MIDLTSAPDFEQITTFIQQRVEAMRPAAHQWADLARQAVQNLPYDAERLTALASYLNTIRAELRRVVLAASEHFSEDQLTLLRKRVGMSKAAWRAAKSRRNITIKHGFSLIIF
jgi:hypothetical protein